MKTEKLKLYVYVKEGSGKVSMGASTDKFNSTYSSTICRVVCAPLTEMEIEVPSITSEEAKKVLTGAMLSSLLEEREALHAETRSKLKQLDQRIAELQCIEFKGDKDA